MADADLSLSERLSLLFEQLGIRRAHVAGAMSELVELAGSRPELLASLTLVCPWQAIAVETLRPLADRLLLVHGDRGPAAPRVPGLLPQLPGAADLLLREYFDALWSNPAADRGGEIGPAMLAFLARAPAAEMDDPTARGEVAGEVAGVTYRARGAGPPLVLFPLTLAASQWDPLLPTLERHYRTVTLGGAHIGPVAVLAQRFLAGYGAAVREFVEAIAPGPDERVLEVGCGPGHVTRLLARRAAGTQPVVAVDVNRYLLREAASLTAAEGLESRIAFQEGNAVDLPFPADSFDVTVSFTVMEEVDADRMLAEMIRVTRPGGRVAVVVRATDMPSWINLPLPPEIMRKVTTSASAGVAEGGCGDASLYRRFRASGLTELRMGPKLGTTLPGPGFAFARPGFETGARGVLDPAEREIWDAAVAQAEADGTLMWAQPLHCAIGTRP
jgi:SAM-dependent methyltransferase